jgi:cell division protein FtsB
MEDGSYLVIIVLLLIAIYIGGGAMAWALSWEARRDRAELRADRRALISENRGLANEILRLKEEIIELRSKLAATIQEINKLSAMLGRSEETGFTG